MRQVNDYAVGMPKDYAAGLDKKIAEVRDFMVAHGITPIEKRYKQPEGRVPVYLDPNVSLGYLQDALKSVGLRCKIHGDQYVIYPETVR